MVMIVRFGYVPEEGTASGEGWTSQQVSSGRYVVTLAAPLTSRPAVTVTGEGRTFVDGDGAFQGTAATDNTFVITLIEQSGTYPSFEVYSTGLLDAAKNAVQFSPQSAAFFFTLMANVAL